MEGVAGPPLEGGDAAHPTPNMATREQPPSKRRRVGVVWDEGNLAKHSAERVTPDHASEEHVFYVDVSSRSAKERHLYSASPPLNGHGSLSAEMH